MDASSEASAVITWQLGDRLPDQIADTFAVLYDWFRNSTCRGQTYHGEAYHGIADNLDYGDRAEHDPAAVDLIVSVANSGWSTPEELRTFLVTATSLDEFELIYKAYLVLYAIDQGLKDYHPDLRTPAPKAETHMTVAGHYRAHGRYNTDQVAGYVLPKRGIAYRGDPLRKHFTTLVRASVNRERMHLIGRDRARDPIWADNPTFAIVPFLYNLEDATFRGLERHGEHFFDVLHQVNGPAGLNSRVRAAVRAIREADVEIGIIPELALNEELVQTLRDELLATTSPRTRLKWLIAGSYHPAPGMEFSVFNAAYMLDRFGRVIGSSSGTPGWQGWIQRKRHWYKLSIGEQATYGLSHLFDSTEPHDREEAISIGTQLFVFESRSGRYAVMICEDWGRDEEACEYMREMNCNVVFVILMDGLMVKQRWAARRYSYVGDETGAHVVISNSFLLQLRQDPNRSGEQPVGLVFVPSRVDEQPEEPVSILAETKPNRDRDLASQVGVIRLLP